MKDIAFEDSYRAQQSMLDWEDVEATPNDDFTEIQLLHWKKIKINADFGKLCQKYEKQFLQIAKERDNQGGDLFCVRQSHVKNGWFKFILQNWTDDWCVSPYSNSFYNSKNISWEHKPDGSIRIASHWNFTTIANDGIHCRTNNPDFTEGWAVGRYNNGVYDIVKVFD